MTTKQVGTQIAISVTASILTAIILRQIMPPIYQTQTNVQPGVWA